jgi:hypothetical protein
MKPLMSKANGIDALSADELPADDVIGIVVAGRDTAVDTAGAAVYATRQHLHAGPGALVRRLPRWPRLVSIEEVPSSRCTAKGS